METIARWKKHLVLISLVTAMCCIVIATLVYPGGSFHDNDSTGFDWSKNFFSNLFSTTAINGSENTSRIWAIVGMLFHAVGYGIFFIHMSKKIPHKHAATVLILTGSVNILFTFLIATPLHDLMVILSSTLFLLALFYITVFIMKTRLHLLKFACIVGLLMYYYTLYLYGTGDWGVLAIMQKILSSYSMVLVLGLEYGAKQEDFKPSI